MMKKIPERRTAMHFTGQVYRHPMEGYTPLLEVTIGCSHNKCAFCVMYDQTPFSVSPMEHIEEDLKELKSHGYPIRRIYLVNADPFVLSTDKLVKIAERILHYFPEIETITGYASINNFKNKTVEDLRLLKSLRYDQFHIGIETMYAPALEQMNKGFTVEDVYEQIGKLKEAGMTYDALLMVGVAGRGNGARNMEPTVKLLNETRPYMISIMPTSVTPGSRLEAMCDRGEFVEPTEGEMLEEEIALLKALTYDDAFLFGSHTYSLVPVSGYLKTDKEKILARLENGLKTLSPDVLNGILPRGHI